MSRNFTTFFFFNATATTEIYTLSLHDALPIYAARAGRRRPRRQDEIKTRRYRAANRRCRSEEHTSELQSQSNLVCRLLLEKKKKRKIYDEQPTRADDREIIRTTNERQLHQFLE